MHAWSRLVAWLKGRTSRPATTAASAARVVSTEKSTSLGHQTNVAAILNQDLPSQILHVPQIQEFLSLIRESAPATLETDQANTKGKYFEQEVAAVLGTLKFIAAENVSIESQPKITLQNAEIVIPDFHLTIESAYERRHYLIECRDRGRDSKDILHKIRHVRDKQRWQTFLFLYPNQISPELARALDAEGIMHLDIEGFRLFVFRLGAELFLVRNVLPYFVDNDILDKEKPQGARLSSDRKW